MELKLVPGSEKYGFVKNKDMQLYYGESRYTTAMLNQTNIKNMNPQIAGYCMAGCLLQAFLWDKAWRDSYMKPDEEMLAQHYSWKLQAEEFNQKGEQDGTNM